MLVVVISYEIGENCLWLSTTISTSFNYCLKNLLDVANVVPNKHAKYQLEILYILNYTKITKSDKLRDLKIYIVIFISTLLLFWNTHDYIRDLFFDFLKLVNIFFDLKNARLGLGVRNLHSNIGCNLD